MEKAITQPSEEIQRIADELMEATPEEVVFRGKKIKIGWLRNGMTRKFSSVMMHEKNSYKRNCKTAAILVLNNVWKIRFCYWFLWRWYYYIVDLDTIDVLRLVDAAKKKVPHDAFLLITIYLTGMKDLMMTMTSKEALRSQAGQRGEQPSR